MNNMTNFDVAFNTPFFMDFHNTYNPERVEVDVPLQVTSKEVEIYKSKYSEGFVNDSYLKLFALFRLVGQVDNLEKALTEYALIKLTEMKERVVDYKTGKKVIQFISDDYHIIEKSMRALENYLGLQCNFYFVEVA